MKKEKAIKQLKELSRLKGSMRLAAESWKTPFQTLIATALSARSLDETTIKYATILFSKYPSAEKLANAKIKDIQKIIKPVNFYKNKSKNIIACSKILDEKYSGKPPVNFGKLIELPGVGRKTANVFLAVMKKPAIGVDTHLAYVSNKLGWSKNKNPHKIESDLQKIFPKRYWRNLNYIVVRFGKTYTSRKQKDEILERVKRLR